MPFDARRPYNDLPPLPPVSEVESRNVLKACIEARAAVAELKSAGGLIPNQDVLVNTIPVLEAQASSEIENIVTTSDELFRFMQIQEKATDPSTKEALRYQSALRHGFASLKERPLCINTAIEICSRLKDADMQIRRVPGVALANAVTREIIYTPPEGEAILREKLANWERFIHDAEHIDPLVRMAVAHYQFEAIHPFSDGTGRTGRVVNLLILVQTGLLDLPILYLSRYILRHRAEYYAGLLAVTRDQAWENWIVWMLTGVTETANWTRDKILAIQGLQAAAIDFVKEHARKIYSRELVDMLFVQPYCRIGNLVEGGIAKRQTASVYLKQLADLGMLVAVEMGREKVFVHKSFLRLLQSDEHAFSSYEDGKG
ncbi:MAG: Fic family protein [Xanthomonadales bacterium]|uniref:protein adenylyltransferase Fic n=1 Tax=Dokdonella sp. TaxID=2291710 RepID=UPI002C99C016|nr:Fic family protein [Xanthomonadales bacterium]MBK7209844.1 Fic family protein [Xanthomonadales bacterium]HQV71405.1 Fic family protein [Dokdonella sp.]HQW76413.1 Fic family protein [Dokdonella sp.]